MIRRVLTLDRHLPYYSLENNEKGDSYGFRSTWRRWRKFGFPFVSYSNSAYIGILLGLLGLGS